MKLSREECKPGLAKLAEMPGFPKEEELERKSQMLEALRYAEDIDHIDRAMSYAWQTFHFCPSPMEIRKSINETYLSKPTHDARCNLCAGTGWVNVTLVSDTGPFKGQTYEALDECSCRTVAPNWAAMDGAKREVGRLEKVKS